MLWVAAYTRISDDDEPRIAGLRIYHGALVLGDDGQPVPTTARPP